MDPGNFTLFSGTLTAHARTVPGGFRFWIERQGTTKSVRVMVQTPILDPQVLNALVAGAAVQVVGSLEHCSWNDQAGNPREMVRILAEQVQVQSGERAGSLSHRGTYSEQQEQPEAAVTSST